ncbi:MAG: NUDIX domain-containing protein, partial [Clostridia bacterium]|nr:NUDIX domain-containing protein [Clostridia bacterium]
MKTIAVFDSKNYDANGPRTLRKAVRAVIMKNGKVALAQSLKEGFYKFPGGGIEEGETHLEALCRETLEELGLTVKADTVKEFGRIYEIRRSLIYDGIFEQENFYY